MGLLRQWRRRRLLRTPLPAGWRAIVEGRMPFFARLPPALQATFLDQLRVFADEKTFVGAGGLEITDEVRVVVSGAAVRLTLGLDVGLYDRLREIVVYPWTFARPDDEGGLLGEVTGWGTVVLSWPAVLHGLAHPCDGHDTGVHEFAHVLDRGNGAVDGTPALHATEDYRAWGRVLGRHFLALRAGDADETAVLRRYGALNEAEFFAVATEAFFEKPASMHLHLPDLYEELRRFYRFDPRQTPVCRPGEEAAPSPPA